MYQAKLVPFQKSKANVIDRLRQPSISYAEVTASTAKEQRPKTNL